MSGFVSVGYTPQTTDICVCRRHADNVGLTRRQHSVKLAFFCLQRRVGESYPQHTFLCGGRNWYYTFLVCAMSPMHAGIRFFCCKEHYFVRGTQQFSRAHNLKKCFLVSRHFIPLRGAHTIKKFFISPENTNASGTPTVSQHLTLQLILCTSNPVLASPWPHPPGFAANAP